MKNNFFYLSFLFISFTFVTNTYGDNLSIIEEISGDVFVLKNGSFIKKIAKEKQGLGKGDILITGDKSFVIIKTKDDSKIVLDENSRLKIESIDLYNQKKGKIYYNIEKKEQKGFLVKTEFAVIGVKGTEFIIDSFEDKKGVALKEGLVKIDSLLDKFELRRKKELSEFESFQMKSKSEFEEYKKKTWEEFVEFVDNFELKPDKMVTFDGNIADENQLSKEMNNQFSKFRGMI